jgi:hypothetical protein
MKVLKIDADAPVDTVTTRAVEALEQPWEK